MATLVLSSVGKLFGPVGQIAGTLIGNAIDQELFGPGDIEGARLNELAVTSSSYGTPIPRQYGAMRMPGTIIWSTDLQEHRDRQSNGKGQPKTVSYSYSVSFAVALSSRPISGVGRIWADGNLLRGTAGDLKSSGTLRIYQGHGDQPRDPLLEASLGAQCPAFRGRAYAVFEDLDLTDFGNRIPSLSFEILAGDASDLIGDLLADIGPAVTGNARFEQLRGFAHDGGNVRNVLTLVDRLLPLYPRTQDAGIVIEDASTLPVLPYVLSAPGSWEDGEFGQQSGQSTARNRPQRDSVSSVSSVRYYDPARDYQPAIQHAEPGSVGTRTLQFPGVFTAADALGLARAANLRSAAHCETVMWRCCELDPAIGPGSLVQLPGDDTLYLVVSWEWRQGGIELELARHRAQKLQNASADAGSAWTPRDRLPSPTRLRVFELPWDGFGDPFQRIAYAAPDAADGLWPGCTLHAAREDALIPLGIDTAVRAVTGFLVADLTPSTAVRLEPQAEVFVQLHDHAAHLPSSDGRGLAQGDNRILIGSEVLQYCTAVALGEGRFRLQGLLRGRGGTERHAQGVHPALTAFTLLDERLVPVGSEALSSATNGIAGLSVHDEEPVLAIVEDAGRFLQPLSPVHGHAQRDAYGRLTLTWVRRARGQWTWPDETDLPLIEESERYEVGCGPLGAPYKIWVVDRASLTLSSAEFVTLAMQYGIDAFWVRQIGSFAKSDPARLAVPT